MQAHIFNEMIDKIGVVRAEQFRRAAKLRRKDPDVASDEWLFTHLPFINDLCLMLMVALRHQVERELMGLAARADGGREIKGEEYRDRVRKLRRDLQDAKHTGGWRKLIEAKLRLKSCKGHDEIEALRHLANSYKHSPSLQPDEDLLKCLKLEPSPDDYGPLPESNTVQEAFAKFVGDIPIDATYCDIAERFVRIASQYLDGVEKGNQGALCRVKWGLVSLSRFAR